MTNINCTENCIYQHDGKCNLNYPANIATTLNPTKCVYYTERSKTAKNNDERPSNNNFK